MKLNRTGSPLTRGERSELNENWETIEKEFNDVVENISDEAFQQVIEGSKIDWSQMVATVSALPSNAEEGETRGVSADNKIYRYDGTNWVPIAEINLNPISEVDTRLNNKIDDSLNSVNTQLAQTEYQLQEGIQNLDSSINENLNDIVKHRPIHTGYDKPSNQIGENGDLYLELYDENEIQFYEEGLFTPYLRGVTNPDIIEYSTQYGRYVRVGNLVTIFIDIELSALTLGSASGTMMVYGLPYSSLIDQNVPLSGSVTGFDLEDENRVLSSAVMGVSQGYFRLHSYLLNDVDKNRRTVSILNINSNFSLRTSFSYLATKNATMQLEKLV